MQTAYYSSPIGVIKIEGDEAGIHSLEFLEEETLPAPLSPSLQECVQQLQEYFHGDRQTFTVSCRPSGTDFQQRVWQELTKIPYGRTATYLDIAKALGDPKAIRAVGAANGRNPVPILIPCHRVIGSNGSLIGYGGGLWRKEFLLKHENALLI